MKQKINLEKMIELYTKHKGCHNKVAKEIGCTREYVRQKLSPLGLTGKGKLSGYKPPKGPTRYTPEFLRELFVKANGKYSEMAKIAGVTPGVISAAITRAELEIELKSKGNLGRPRKKKRVVRTFVDMNSVEGISA